MLHFGSEGTHILEIAPSRGKAVLVFRHGIGRRYDYLLGASELFFEDGGECRLLVGIGGDYRCREGESEQRRTNCNALHGSSFGNLYCERLRPCCGSILVHADGVRFDWNRMQAEPNRRDDAQE